MLNTLILPITSIRTPLQAESGKLKEFLETDKHGVHLIPTNSLVKALHEAVIFAYGNRYSQNQLMAKKYAEKAFQIMLLIIATRVNKADEFVPEAQSMAASMEILSFYFVGSLDLQRVRFIVEEASRIWELYPDAIKTPTLHRILTMQVGAILKDADTLPLLKKLDDLNLPVDETGASGHIVRFRSALNAVPNTSPLPSLLLL